MDKPYAKNMDLVYRQWSGKHHGVVSSINLITLLWTDGNAAIPIDFGIYDIDADGKTLKKNWLVNPDNTRNVQIQEIGIPPEGREVHLKAYGFIKVFKIVAKDGDIEYWATDLLEMDEVNRDKLGGHSRKIEEYRRGIKQFLCVESCQARIIQAQRARIMFSLRAFIRLDVERLERGISWFEFKRRIIRDAI